MVSEGGRFTEMNKFLEILTAEFSVTPVILKGAYPTSIPVCEVPKEHFSNVAGILQQQRKALLAAEWAADETSLGRGFGVYACFRRASEYLIVKISVTYDEPTFPTLTGLYVPAYRFERQIRCLMGLAPVGHPDSRPWIKFEDWPANVWPLRKSFNAQTPITRISGDYHFARTVGEGIIEIPVGPVHAGIIEPGHFRFHAVGEDILNLEERLGYVHKGIEKRFESMSWKEGAKLAGRVSGDTTVAHALCYCRALESMCSSDVPQRAHWLRALFLERERIVNHIGDIGAICNDAAFALILYQMMRLKEIMLRTHHKLFGHRLLMDCVVPGGVSCDIDSSGIALIIDELKMIEKDFERIVIIIDESSSLEDRLRSTGYLSSEEARELGMTGFVARASGMQLDCRVRHPFVPYTELNVQMKVLNSGDVHARVWIRVEEVRESIRLIREILKKLPDGQINCEIGEPETDTSGFSAVEGWRGEILYWLQADHAGKINRCMVRDPSSLNWIGLERCVLGNIVPDFPLCNKSFNQSYSGHDV
jgi:Ni,Fe-hydrogenase III large subunit/Ni,Fe-hydrogenase III component G